MALQHLDPQIGIAFDRVMGRNIRYDALHAPHHSPKRDLRRRRVYPVIARNPHLMRDFRAFYQRLGGHAAIVQAISAHLVAFNQRDLRLCRRRDIGRNQPCSARTYHHQIAVKPRRPRPARIGLAPLPVPQARPRHPRQQPQGRKRQQKRRRGDVGNPLQPSQLRACIHVNQRGGQHCNQADSGKNAGADWRQTHQQVHRKEGHHGDQPQACKVERPVLGQPAFERGKARAKPRPHPVAQQKPCRQKGQRRADRCRRCDQRRTKPKSEQRPARQRHPDRDGQGQRHRRDIGGKEQNGKDTGMIRPPSGNQGQHRAQPIRRQVLPRHRPQDRHRQ